MENNSRLEIIKELIKTDLKINNHKTNPEYDIELISLSKELNKIPNNELIEILYRHRLIEYIYENKRIMKHLINIKNDLEKIYKKLFLSNIRNLNYIKCITNILEENNIKVIVLKGAAVSYLTKRKYTSRLSSDLDLFIKQKDIFKAHKVLETCGYLSKSNYDEGRLGFVLKRIHHNFTYEVLLENKDKNLINIDLHWRLSIYNSFLPEFHKAWKESKIVKINNIKLRCLNEIDTLKHICAHSAKDKWMCLGNLLDIHLLTKRITYKDLDKLNNNRQIKISMFATYLMTKYENYKYYYKPNYIERIYINYVSDKFQKLPLKYKGFVKNNYIYNSINLVHLLYLSNNYKEFALFLFKSIWLIIPKKIKKIFMN